MKAIAIDGYGGVDQLHLRELPDPRPQVLDNEGAGVIDDAGESGLAVGSRVMFTGPYGVGENGAWQDWLLVRPEHFALAPDAIDWRPIRERNQ
jgi:NADPH:quinone reductase-like Zn-dependent oxidoreductase